MLTFIDMSSLSYLSKSVSNDMRLTDKMQKHVIIPESTKTAIVEDELEDDYGSEEEPKSEKTND